MKDDPLTSKKGGQIGILMTTAFIGQGDSQKAISICETLLKHKDDSIRQHAKYLISILNSPKLERPSEWSINIPVLDLDNEITKSIKSNNKNIDHQKHPDIPATGITKNPGLGFTFFTTIILFLLTILLSGCVQFKTNIKIIGPDRIKLSWEISSNSNQLLPWQEKLQEGFRGISPQANISSNKNGKQLFEVPSLSSNDADILLQNIISIAANAAGFEAPSSSIHLTERNLLIGIDQQLDLNIDLRDFPDIPNLNLAIFLDPASSKNNPKGNPVKPILLDNNLKWELQNGEINKLFLHRWQWSRLGLGTLLIILIMGFSMILQTLKLKMGFGFPELPP
ncbi:hypothetical protein EV11_0589 [Prochlorococcus sp. SS52]|nr:hypothetical protein EV09_1879 [Prochlorococcus marinus str. SS35]KGG33844.1 hypothetical protein EV10_0281 [Prochlorococcus marinus str. SS51]KGG36807.1 hypothetical protein EV11_0589 [Prochlorococcus sp. SS52]